MMDLAKWTEKTAQAVRHVCYKKQKICIGFGLVFFDPFDHENKYDFDIQIAFDPNNPPSENERKDIQMSMEIIVDGIRRIMAGESLDKEKMH